MYEKEGFYAKGGGIYSSDSLYILTISKDGNMIGHEPFRAKNMKEAREMAEDMEEKYTSKLGGDLEFSIKQAMAEGGETDDTDDNGGVIYEKIKNYPIFETEEEAKSFIKIGKPFLRKQLREGKIVLLYNGEGYYLADVKGGYMADGGETDMLKEDDYVWNAVGKKLIVYKVTDDEYFLSGFMQKGASPWSKVKVHEYIKNGEWSLKPKMADGGEVGRKFSIREMKEKLNKMFPDSFGFTVGNFSKEGDLFKNSSALIVDRNSPFNGLQDSEIKSNLFFPQYKRDHDIRFRIYQGGENTYFYFLLESENTDQYIGQFGFKDEGDVSADYITRLIAFLMEQ